MSNAHADYRRVFYNEPIFAGKGPDTKTYTSTVSLEAGEAISLHRDTHPAMSTLPDVDVLGEFMTEHHAWLGYGSVPGWYDGLPPDGYTGPAIGATEDGQVFILRWFSDLKCWAATGWRQHHSGALLMTDDPQEGPPSERQVHIVRWSAVHI